MTRLRRSAAAACTPRTRRIETDRPRELSSRPSAALQSPASAASGRRAVPADAPHPGGRPEAGGPRSESESRHQRVAAARRRFRPDRRTAGASGYTTPTSRPRFGIGRSPRRRPVGGIIDAQVSPRLKCPARSRRAPTWRGRPRGSPRTARRARRRPSRARVIAFERAHGVPLAHRLLRGGDARRLNAVALAVVGLRPVAHDPHREAVGRRVVRAALLDEVVEDVLNVARQLPALVAPQPLAAGRTVGSWLVA